MTQVLDNMAEQMDALQALFVQSAEGRDMVNHKLSTLIDNISAMNERQDQSDTIAASLERVAVGQEALTEVMRAYGSDAGIDAESRMRLRSIDVQMLRILEEISAGRQESLAVLRRDIDMLVRTFARPRGRARAAVDPDSGEV